MADPKQSETTKRTEPSEPVEVRQLVDKGVTLSTAAFNELMARLSTLEETTKMVYDVQDRSKLDKIEGMRRAGKLVKNVKLRVLDGKIVIGWKTLHDEVFFADGKLIENQKVEVYMEDKSKRELTMRQWASLPAYREFEVIRESRAENGQIFFSVRADDGKELEVDITYIN